MFPLLRGARCAVWRIHELNVGSLNDTETIDQSIGRPGKGKNLYLQPFDLPSVLQLSRPSSRWK